jgi:hypothetical protein
VNLFSVIEGLKEENLSSAILRLLLLRSEDIRERFVALVSLKCRRGPVTIGDQFACVTEHPTSDDSNGSGRLDLVIETANTVIGVENKLFAEFQQGQPEKYLRTLEEHAQKLKDLRGTRFEHVLVILAPESRKAGVEVRINACREPERYISLTWQETLREIGTPEGRDPATVTILEAFRQFLLDEKLAFMPQFERLVPHLRGSFEPRGNTWQRDVVGRIWRFFPDAGRRMSSGETWVGFYFCSGRKEQTAWYGFLPRGVIRSGAGHNAAELVVATSYPVTFASPAIQPIELAPNFLGRGVGVHAWAINYDATWADPKKWQEELRPLTEAVEALPLDLPEPEP